MRQKWMRKKLKKIDYVAADLLQTVAIGWLLCQCAAMYSMYSTEATQKRHVTCLLYSL